MAIYQGNKKAGYNIDTTVYSTCPIGTILSYGGSNIPSGYLLCDGNEVSKETYKDLYEIIGDTYGNSTDNTKFKLPDLRDKFIQGANNNLGTNKNAGLPNITGKFFQDINAKGGLSGAFAYEGTGQKNLANDAPSNSGFIVLDASKSNSIYGNSDTVQPPSVCLNFIIKALNVKDKSLDSKELFSTDEIKTDKVWIDGKPIYRKIYTSSDFNFTDDEQQGTSKTNISNIEDLVNISGRCKATLYFVPLNIGKWRGDATGTCFSSFFSSFVSFASVFAYCSIPLLFFFFIFNVFITALFTFS